MDRSQTVNDLRRHEAPLRRMGVTRLALFGSLARGEARPDSDIDVVVDIAPNRKYTLVDHSTVRLYLADLFGRDVDVVVRRAMPREMRRRVADEEVPVF